VTTVVLCLDDVREDTLMIPIRIAAPGFWLAFIGVRLKKSIATIIPAFEIPAGGYKDVSGFERISEGYDTRDFA